ncbi:MAG: hypothetical protein ACO1NO_03470 [Burkholderiaceae bacterium]
MRSIRHSVYLSVAPVSFCLCVHAFAQEAEAPGNNPDASLVEQVRLFLEHFIDPHKTPTQQAALFTQDAEYYGRKEVGNAEIIRDIKYFTRRWPARSYSLASIHYITPDPASDRVFVSYEISYRVANDRKAASGKARYGAVIANLSSAPKIEWIKEKIVN